MTTESQQHQPTTMRVVESEPLPCSLANNTSSGLLWQKISVTALKKTGETDTTVLHGVTGMAERGRLTCIVGGSGAGKTSLIKVLAGRIRASKDLVLEGQVFLDGKKVDPGVLASSFGGAKKHLGYVPQQDTHIKTITPREAIRFSAKLRLSKHATEKEIDDLVQNTLKELRLSTVADRYGSNLSGGEMRRLSLGVELATKPSIMLLDEVTSGLDSHSAAVVMEICRVVAREQQVAMLLSVHQPNSEVFEKMDTCILMHNGRFMYQGEASGMMDYMTSKGLPPPVGYNAPDWAIKVAQTNSFQDLCNKHGFFDAVEESKFFLLDNDSHDTMGSSSNDEDPCASVAAGTDKASHSFQRVSLLTETKEIMRRDFRNLWRDHEALKLRILTVVVISGLLAICFWQIGSDSLYSASAFSYHVGSIFLLSTATFVPLLMVITDSIEQRQVFVREHSAGYYRALPNAITKILLDAVILAVFTITILLISFWSLDMTGSFTALTCALFLGSMVANALGHFFVTIPENAALVMDLVPLVLTPQTLFCGFIIAVDALPKWIRWFSWLQPLTYLYRILLKNEFSSCLEHTPEETLLLNCARAAREVLHTNGVVDLAGLYDDNTVLSVPTVGVFVGNDAIQEYVRYFSVQGDSGPDFLLWDTCSTEGTQIIELQEVGEGYCEITLAHAVYSLVNPKLRSSPEKIANSMVFGDRFRLEYGEDGKDAHMASRNVYFPPQFSTIIGGTVDDSIMRSHVCVAMEDYCPSVFEQNGFETPSDCTEALAPIPVVTRSHQGIDTIDGNSLGCRHVHSTLAKHDPSTHCPHMSLLPMEDPAGKVKCQDSYNFTYEEFFTPEDFALFDLVATRNGLDESHMHLFRVEESPPPEVTCVQSVVSSDDVVSSFGLPSDHFCSSYLETQKATDESAITGYWLALLGMWCVFRGLSIWSLKHKGTL
ncbi:Putative white-brown complex homolog protein 30 [Seminavis robusta]|uniref:White-brown complex homolog protein 30 n=1 Tax=Seminavis robusta TaxID=568900 RepID=A0A9N8H2D7_9STRA|nr:Putative white-brown complex homolog protein 30 [Seminavis robusta]|eukprot:Sro7_g006000.1 Putative white-brown complex homolog protein 30 (941) ;mRNA; f:113907-117118